ncbi:cupin domain-containing protein [Chloroflexus aurantiacus]
MDTLTCILNLARLKSSVYCRSELGSPWGLHFAPRSCAVFHVLHRGNGFFRVAGAHEWTPLREGDLLLLPHGQEHLLLETPDTHPLRNLELDQWGECALMRWSDMPSAVLLCGTFDFEYVHDASLFRYLPDVIHIPYHAARPLNRVLELMADEAEAQRPAKEVVLRRLADILFVQIVQYWVEMYGTQGSGWLGAFHDPLIGKALALMHAHPQQDWQVASLARALACSRSTFAARFTALVGEPPMEYLTRWRMQIASRLLIEDPSLRVGEVAARVGYRSEAAFSKAFKRLIGIAPTAYRSAVGHRVEATRPEVHIGVRTTEAVATGAGMRT